MRSVGVAGAVSVGAIHRSVEGRGPRDKHYAPRYADGHGDAQSRAEKKKECVAHAD